MAEMDDKLGAILNNPAMMQQIMSMAQTLGQQAPPPQPEPAAGPDPAMLQNIMRLSSQTGIDSNQETLLAALKPSKTGKGHAGSKAGKSSLHITGPGRWFPSITVTFPNPTVLTGKTAFPNITPTGVPLNSPVHRRLHPPHPILPVLRADF